MILAHKTHVQKKIQQKSSIGPTALEILIFLIYTIKQKDLGSSTQSHLSCVFITKIINVHH